MSAAGRFARTKFSLFCFNGADCHPCSVSASPYFTKEVVELCERIALQLPTLMCGVCIFQYIGMKAPSHRSSPAALFLL